ncbi:polysaccharide biosynthesis tyrosine autokinase [Desulfobacterium sp. N47]
MGKMFEALQKAEDENVRTPQAETVEPSLDNDTVFDDNLVCHFQSNSIVSEQFRKLRTYLFMPALGAKPKTILMTSAVSGEGKSLIAINLAITIAKELHSHALLMDCDLRNPSLSRWFGVNKAKGLSDYLVGNSELPDLLIKTGIDKLNILPGGDSQENPAELIGSKKMEGLIDELKSRYSDRHIILDSSPVLATTEPQVLYKVVDCIILVVRAGVTPRGSVQQAIKFLGKEKIVGVVLNDMNFRSAALRSRYFGTSRYYPYYGSDNNDKNQNFGSKFNSIFKKKQREQHK